VLGRQLIEINRTRIFLEYHEWFDRVRCAGSTGGASVGRLAWLLELPSSLSLGG
jgi:hypothetical protein